VNQQLACDLIVSNAAELCLVPPGGNSLGVVAGGTVACLNGRVIWAGPHAHAKGSLAPLPGCVTVDAGGQVVTPGLVDPHTHLPSYGVRAREFELKLRGAGYLEILAAGGGILSTVATMSAASDATLRGAARGDLDFMLGQGVTTVEAKSGYGLTADAELRLLRLAAEAGSDHPVTVVPTFLGAHAIPPTFKGKPDAYVEVILEDMLPAVSRQGIAQFCDVFCEPGVFSVEQSRRILQEGERLGLRAKLHADELAAGGGAELAAEVGAVSADHLLFASPTGLAAMAAAGTVAVILPVTVLALLGGEVGVEHCRRQVAQMRDAGVQIAIGTDYNPGTAPCRSMQLAMSLASRVFGLSSAETILAATTHAAAALGLVGKVGSLVPGSAADLVIWEAASHEEIPYRLGENQAAHVYKAGRLVKGRMTT